MGVCVDETRGHDQARGVDLVLSGLGDLADCYDILCVDGEITGEWLRTCAVDDRSASNHQVMCHVAARWVWLVSNEVY